MAKCKTCGAEATNGDYCEDCAVIRAAVDAVMHGVHLPTRRVMFTDVEPAPCDEDTQPVYLPGCGHEPLFQTCMRGDMDEDGE